MQIKPVQLRQRCTGNHKLFAVIICCLLAIPMSIAAVEKGNCRQAGPLVFGILPYISAEQLVYRFSPLANYLSEKLQVPVRIETAPHFIEFARRTHEDQHYDILFTAPHLYTQASHKAGFRLIASIDSPDMWAVIVVPKQSDIQIIEDLRGKHLATVHPLGLSTLLIRKRLLDADIDPDVDLNLVITPSHDASLLSAYYGVTDNSGSINCYARQVTRLLHKWLNRRGKRGCCNWDKFCLLLERYPLPSPCIKVNLF